MWFLAITLNLPLFRLAITDHRSPHLYWVKYVLVESSNGTWWGPSTSNGRDPGSCPTPKFLGAWRGRVDPNPLASYKLDSHPAVAGLTTSPTWAKALNDLDAFWMMIQMSPNRSRKSRKWFHLTSHHFPIFVAFVHCFAQPLFFVAKWVGS